MNYIYHFRKVDPPSFDPCLEAYSLSLTIQQTTLTVTISTPSLHTLCASWRKVSEAFLKHLIH
jgi:hypothetical protein